MHRESTDATHATHATTFGATGALGVVAGARARVRDGSSRGVIVFIVFTASRWLSRDRRLAFCFVRGLEAFKHQLKLPMQTPELIS